KVFKTVGQIWKPTGQTFTIVGNVCPLIRIATTTIVPHREPIPKVISTDKLVVTLVYSKKTKAANKKVPVSNSTITKSLVANKMKPNNSWGSSSSNVPSPLIDCRLSKSSSGKQSVYSVSTRHDGVLTNPSFVQGIQDQVLALASSLVTSKLWCYQLSSHTSSGPALNEMILGTISSGLVQKSSPLTSYVPPLRNNWDLLFQLMFDELLNPSPSVVNQAPEVITPIAEVIPPVHADSTGSPSSTTVDQDAPSLSKSHTTIEIQSLVIPQDVGDDNLDMEVAHLVNDLLFGVLIPEVTST
nr:hypothetical protein [Tanacetum cinerariifolium]